MKIAGYIMLILGILSTLGAILGGTSPIGGLFFLGLGIFFIIRAKQKAEDEAKKKDWENNEHKLE